MGVFFGEEARVSQIHCAPEAAVAVGDPPGVADRQQNMGRREICDAATLYPWQNFGMVQLGQ